MLIRSGNESNAIYQKEMQGLNAGLVGWLLSIFLLLIGIEVLGQKHSEEALFEDLKKSKDGTAERVDALLNLANFVKTVQDNTVLADSLLHEAVGLAKALKDESLFIKSVEYYIDYSNLAENATEATTLAKECLFEGEKKANTARKWYGNYFMSKISYARNEFADALIFAKEALRIAKQNGNHDFQIKSELLAGQCQNRIGDNINAFQHLVTALDLLEAHPNKELRMQVYDAMAYFYLYNNRPGKSLEYSVEKLRIIESEKPIDSLQWIFTQFQILQCEMELNKDIPIDWLVECINLTKRKGYVAVKSNLWSLYRTYLIRNEMFGQLYQLYNIEFPEELMEIHRTQRKLYVRLMAYFSEIEGNLTASEKYWEEALRYGKSEADQFIKINLLIRYAQFLLRHNKYDRLEAILMEAYELSKEIPYLPFMIEALSTLEKYNMALGNYQKAYLFADERFILKDSLNRQNKSEAVMNMELDFATRRLNEQRQREKELQQEQIRQEKLKSQAFGIGLIIFLLLSGLIFRQYRQTNKERKRSDELLLNILPEQTANELKNKGVTTAKKYDNVTVLFSDFVGFTRMSEKLSPEELVAEIDRYFSTFDEIIMRYGLEKIKTIGDAYVAVSGMPEGNQATAVHAAKAALEMMAFVEETKKVQMKEGKPFFEMRMGMHSGSVVAGVVGKKKFQFDIWGDTVNMVARMEQNSIPGKVNISGELYKLIQTDFQVEYRGKIEAKNKGDVDMYFLNQSL